MFLEVVDELSISGFPPEPEDSVAVEICLPVRERAGEKKIGLLRQSVRHTAEKDARLMILILS